MAQTSDFCRHPTSLPILSTELICMILIEADRDTQKTIRLCCKWLAAEGARHLFQTICINLNLLSMEWVIQLAQNESAARAVERLVLFEPKRWALYSFDEFCNQVLDESSSDDHDYLRQLYQEYLQEREQRDPLVALDRAPTPPTDPDHALQVVSDFEAPMTRQKRACVMFHVAILKLSNLKAVEMDCQFFNQRNPQYMWRGYHLPENSHNLTGVEVREENVRSQAFLLRALGWRNFFSKSMTALNFSIAKWCGPKDICSVWLRNEEAHVKFKVRRLQDQFILMANAFVHLTDLDLSNLLDCENQFPSVIILARWLGSATNLQRLNLAFFSDMDQLWDDSLGQIISSEPVHWPHLRILALTVGLSSDSLCSFLSAVAPTLVSLSLTRCVLQLGDEWPVLYDRLREVPFRRLRNLLFERCLDLDQEEPPEFKFVRDENGAIIANQQVPTVVHRSMGEEAEEFQKACTEDIYSYILKETDIKPQIFLWNF